MRQYKIGINYDYDDPVEITVRKLNGVGNYMVPWLLDKAMRKRENITVYNRTEIVRGIDVRGNRVGDIDLVINSMPINGVGFIKLKKGLTSWWDLEECSDPKQQYYKACDIIFHPNYNPNRWNLYPKEKASYLPLANDFEVSRYFPEEPKELDISFLGREDLPAYDKRRRILDTLGETYRISRGSLPRGEHSSRFISRGKLTIQISGWDNLEERFFQFGSIRPLLADYLKEIDLVAEKDKEYISFSSDEECYEKVKYYLEHLDEAEAIGNRLIERIKREHTYDNRVDEILRVLDTGELDHRGWYLWEGKHD